ncbi:MAG: hypothetical protein JW869_04465 [Candidatus Omnitrophica bacterium]|nr:hypothetical protein [Candidatus Omnitrophota bacterium]
MIKKPDNPNGNAHRVITFLTREELDFLDKLGKDALFSAGIKLSRSKIISAIVNVVRKLNIDACGLRSKRQLEARIMETIKEINKNSEGRSNKKNEDNKENKDGQDGKSI